jgi:hypothetical protein
MIPLQKRPICLQLIQVNLPVTGHISGIVQYVLYLFVHIHWFPLPSVLSNDCFQLGDQVLYIPSLKYCHRQREVVRLEYRLGQYFV